MSDDLKQIKADIGTIALWIDRNEQDPINREFWADMASRYIPARDKPAKTPKRGRWARD